MKRAFVISALLIVAACSDDKVTVVPTTTTFTSNPVNGALEVPAKTVAGTAVATYVLSADKTKIDYTITTTGLTGITLAHIHRAPPGVSGGVILNLYVPASNIGTLSAAGVITGTATAANVNGFGTVAPLDSVVKYMSINDTTYTNIHTTANPAGEIRGPVRKQ